MSKKKYANHHLFFEDEVRFRLRIFVAGVGGQAEVARVCGVSRSYLNDMVHGKRALNDRVLKVMGFERVEFYRKLASPKKKETGK